MLNFIEPYITADIILDTLDTVRHRMSDQEIISTLKEKKHEPNNIRAALKQLVEDKYIQVDGTLNDWYIRMGHGATFTDKGGYKKHFESLNETEIKEAEIKELNNEKTKIDLANAKRVYKTYPSTRVMAIVATIVSVTLLLLKLAEVFGWLGRQK